jgi:hypothetical protein
MDDVRFLPPLDFSAEVDRRTGTKVQTRGMGLGEKDDIERFVKKGLLE